MLLTVGASAQIPDVEIFWDEADRLDTVIDFDVTLEGTPVYRRFTVVNHSPFAVTIPELLSPYFVIRNVPERQPQDPQKDEFGASDPFPFVVPANSQDSFQIMFKSFKDIVDLPPDVVTEALLFLNVVPASNPGSPGVNKVFRLKALKTSRPLASNQPTLSFDSVYVHPNPAPSLVYSIRNVSQGEVEIDSQVVLYRTSQVTAVPEIQIDTHPFVKFAPRENVTWNVTYRPEDQGRDSLSFLVYYYPTPTSAQNIVTTEISGVGVEQKISDVSFEGTANSDTLRDTTAGNIIVDFGQVPANGTTYVGTIIVRNEGNLNLGYDDERQIGSDPSAFGIRLPWAGGRGGVLPRGAFDTLIVTFTPTSSGEHSSSYVLTSDIKRRNIKGIPDGANTFTVFLRGFGERPQLQVPSSVDFGTIVLRPGCASTSSTTLRVANVGNAPLFVDSITVVKGTGNLTLFNSKFSIGIGGSEELRLEYEPAVVGLDGGVITLWTNAVTSRVDVAYTANVVPREATMVAIPERTAARPGEVITIPVIVEGSAVKLTNLSSFTLTFDPSLMRYHSLTTLGTASQGALLIQESESPRGVLKISLDRTGNFLEQDTLVLLQFDTYLGNKISTAVSLADGTVTFGNAGCVSVLDVRTTSGLFSLDSICGLDYKTSGGRSSLQAGVFPNPAFNDVSIGVTVRDTVMVSITLRDALGRSRLAARRSELITPGTTHVIPVSVAGLETGTYYLELRTDYSVTTIPVVVRQ